MGPPIGGICVPPLLRAISEPNVDRFPEPYKGLALLGQSVRERIRHQPGCQVVLHTRQNAADFRALTKSRSSGGDGLSSLALPLGCWLGGFYDPLSLHQRA